MYHTGRIATESRCATKKFFAKTILQYATILRIVVSLRMRFVKNSRTMQYNQYVPKLGLYGVHPIVALCNSGLSNTTSCYSSPNSLPAKYGCNNLDQEPQTFN